MNRPLMIRWLHEQASGPMANDPRQVDTCNTLTAIRLELERLATRRQEIDDEAAGYAEEIEALRATVANLQESAVEGSDWKGRALRAEAMYAYLNPRPIYTTLNRWTKCQPTPND